MDEQRALHTAARRYCRDRYREVRNSPHVDRPSVRQDILDDIRDAFDEFNPDTLPEEGELRVELKRSAWSAVHKSKYYDQRLGKVDDDLRRVEDSEYRPFEEYLRNLDHAKLARVGVRRSHKRLPVPGESIRVPRSSQPVEAP